MEILKCKGVRKIYGSGDSQVIALDSVDLSVEKGEFTAIVGASGSGKSTLLHILGTVRPPNQRKRLDRRNGYLCHESNAGSDFPEKENRPGLSVL